MYCGLSHHTLTSLEARCAQLWLVGRSVASDFCGPAFLVVLRLEFPLLTGEGLLIWHRPHFHRSEIFGGNLSIDYPDLSTPHLMRRLLVEMVEMVVSCWLAQDRHTHSGRQADR